MAKTIAGLMDSSQEAHDVVHDLLHNGYRKESISLMATTESGRIIGADVEHEGGHRAAGAAKGAGTGAALGGVAGLLIGLAGFAIPGIGAIIAAGPVAAALAGASIGAVAGGAVGGLTKLGIPKEDAHYYAEGLRRGGFLVTVTTDDASADQAEEIMRKHGAVDIRKRAEEWKKAGWKRFEGR